MRTRASALLWTIVAIFGAAWAHAVELTGRPQVIPTLDGATLRWQTDVACGTRLQYGLSPAALDQHAEAGVTSDHEVRLQGLKAGTTYHYSLGSARVRLAAGSFTTLGRGAAPASAAPAGASSSPSTAAPATKPSLIDRVLEVVTPGKKPAPAAAPAKAAPPARQTWGNIATLADHYERHGRDFGSKSPEEYAAGAWQFLQKARSENLPMKLDDTDNTLRIFDPQTRAFAAYNGAGRTKTYFKPENPDYWRRQPGRAVTSRDLPFPLFSP